MAHWMRFEHGGRQAFGTLDGDTIAVHEGDLLGDKAATGETVALGEVTVLTPCEPSKMVALWNNSKASAEKQKLDPPEEPLIFLKASNTYLASGGTIQKPASYDGRVMYEAELGVVIGRDCKGVGQTEAADYIFGYTCVNDVTALQILDKDPQFPQWARAKGYDTFGAFGPVIATGLDPDGLIIRAELNGRERQNYTVSDMFFSPLQLVSLISQDMTLLAGDIIACGTGPGALPMKPGAQIDVIIDGIGTLSNTYGE